jgi:urea transport system substrate-binding protein
VHSVQAIPPASAFLDQATNKVGSTEVNMLHRFLGGVEPKSRTTGISSMRSSLPLDPHRELNIALCVPLAGAAGIWGPSALASAKLAIDELNQASGISGRPCQLINLDAADEAAQIESSLVSLIEAGEIDAIVGMHTSSMRQRIIKSVGSKVPFVYTPLYEGGISAPNVFAIGETTNCQLLPAIAWLAKKRQPKRWFAVGNDYIWPRVSHHLAKKYMAENGCEMVREAYVPIGTSDYAEVLDAIHKSRADAVLVSLVGQDAVDFNRSFGLRGLSKSVLRLSCAVGENELLAIGSDNSDDLYVSSGYFASLDTDANLAFKDRYVAKFGERAPTLNTFGQSTYEGVHFLASLLRHDSRPRNALTLGPISYLSARESFYAGPGVCSTPIYLACSDGASFKVIARL